MPGKPGQRKEKRRSLFPFKKSVRKRFRPLSYWKRKRQQVSISDTQVIEVAEVVLGVEETTEHEAETASDCEATTDRDSPSFTTSHTSQHNVPIPLESKANPFNLDHDYGSKIGSQPSTTDHDYC
ncbi:uncharacterized protein LOC117643259 isoform X2 [Thrips palmi]|uniref:Uncharacterized protein LOC117643259 isoform X2 n=1 Tax=Thrips palmi TaxID=161013 RepID=A0A6P8YDZ5_THRPL|nr:uncharacterized protein LOC117643259 isoform X2 [Thrips palmi]